MAVSGVGHHILLSASASVECHMKNWIWFMLMEITSPFPHRILGVATNGI
jgi:hypothetical protein